MYIYRVQYRERERKKKLFSAASCCEIEERESVSNAKFCGGDGGREGSSSVEIYRILDPDKFKIMWNRTVN